MSPEFAQLDVYAKQLFQKIIADLPPTAQRIKLSSNIDVFGSGDRKNKLYLLKEGVLGYSVNKKIIYYFDAGDVVGIEHMLTKTAAKVLTDFAVVVDEYSGQALMEHIAKDPERIKMWSEFIITESYMLSHYTAALVHHTEDNHPDIRTYKKGESIIEQGSEATEVFTLVEGEAEAVVNDVKVGDIVVGELFGVIAALTSIPRTASVVAKKNSVALVMGKDNFVHLIESHPAMVLKMVEDMANTLVALNQKVVGLSLSKF